MAAEIKKSVSWKMFNEISPKYDFLNHLLSFGIDHQWRKRLSTFLVFPQHKNVLDLATGTADVLLSLKKHNPQLQSGHGLDMAEKMLEIGRTKIARQGLSQQLKLTHGDANHLPFETETFDNVTMAFGIRNVEEPVNVLKEIHRVLTPQGRGLILEFSLPHNPIIRAVHLFYLRTMVPMIGGLFSGNSAAYTYLNQTIETFPFGDKFCRLMQEAGFTRVKANPLLFGVATIYQGDKA